MEVKVKGITLRGNPTIKLRGKVVVERLPRRLRSLVQRLRRNRGRMRLNTLTGGNRNLHWSTRIMLKLRLVTAQ